MDRIQFLGFLQVEEKGSEAVMTAVACSMVLSVKWYMS